MSKDKVFSFRITEEERDIVTALADYLECSLSDAMRFLLKQADGAMESLQPGHPETDESPEMETE